MPDRRMHRLWPLAVCAALAACADKAPPSTPAPVPVETALVAQKAMPELVHAVGTVEAIDSVAVRTQVDGELLAAQVRDGENVKKGQPLFTIDPRPAHAALAQAQAALARDIAARDLAHAQVVRYAPVAKKGFISADQMQQYVTAEEAAAASVKVDQANVEAAQLTLGYTTIAAPIEGRAGRILVQPGNVVKTTDADPLLVINRITPIYVNFAVPGRYVDRVRAAQAKGALAVQASGDGFAAAVEGRLAFVDNAVDPATNTIKLRGEFANANQALWPGQFVNITLTLGSEANALAIPDAAVKAGPDGNYVFVIKADGTAEQRGVTVARDVNGEAVVASGLSVGETVVTDGQSRLADGTPVRIAQAA
ncbi:MAG: efflux RND transporter periplasmic adaptor subunit, partial [Proteobacteria bacterium]|nr:efflux RND transporter periplasmic adaptor subunit [Pseudomonadota bacterium]